MSSPVCQCCKQQRAALSATKSKLISSVNIIRCGTCARSNHEPRHIVVIAAKSNIDVTNYVKNRQYCGKALEAIEILP